MDKQKVRELALANGFKLKPQPDGSDDLNPYVYEFAAALAKSVFFDGYVHGYNSGRHFHPFAPNEASEKYTQQDSSNLPVR